MQARRHDIFWTIVMMMAIPFLGSLATERGMVWYSSLTLPSITPPGEFIGIIWTVLYVLIGFALLRTWRRTSYGENKKIRLIFVANLILNTLWTPIFFGLGALEAALLVLFFIVISGAILAVKMWKIDYITTLLLTPYVVWTVFATYLNILIITLN